MKITINGGLSRDSSKSHDDLTTNQVAELMFRISLANGYHQQNVAMANYLAIVLEAFYELGKAQIEMEEYNEH
jgi:hypothetical protein